jgi:hypothetical protein
VQQTIQQVADEDDYEISVYEDDDDSDSSHEIEDGNGTQLTK